MSTWRIAAGPREFRWGVEDRGYGLWAVSAGYGDELETEVIDGGHMYDAENEEDVLLAISAVCRLLDAAEKAA